MSVKIFISYSHKDEEFKDEFIEHLGSLKQNNIISEWNDRKITGTDNWENEIDENLETSNIIIFLVSSAFISSEYCFGVEAKKALALHKESKARVLPIIIRSVDWQDNDFSKLQSAPKDLKPVSLWKDRDSAWLDTIRIIKGIIDKYFLEEKHINNSIQINHIVDKEKTSHTNINLTNETLEWLEDTSIKLTHRKLDYVELKDIYISPALKKDTEKNDLEKNKPLSSDIIFLKKDKYTISGEEQNGKTSLLKKWCKELLKNDFVPVYLNAESIKRSDLDTLLQKALKQMYTGIEVTEYLTNDKRAICIDNLDLIGLNDQYLKKFLDEVEETFSWVVITFDNTYKLLTKFDSLLNPYNSYTLFNFGNEKREELIAKWVTLGQEETIQEDDLYLKVTELKREIDAIVKNNIVPSKPIYLLMILQVFEAKTKLNFDLTSHGHCYQRLIIQSFENANVKPNDYDMYLNVLTELSWWIFINKVTPNTEQIKNILSEYRKIYILPKNNKIIETLIEHHVLQTKNNLIGFKYPYIYYFFVGKRIAETYTKENETRKQLSNIIKNIHREDYANILIFITHHTKEDWILKDIHSVLSGLFEKENKASLEPKQLEFMRNFLKTIPDLVIQQKEISKSRLSINRQLDELDSTQKPNDSEDLSEDHQQILANVNKTFKGMEVTGQIIRNRHASLKRDEIYELVNKAISSGLRLLNYCLDNSKLVKDEIIQLISDQVQKDPSTQNIDIKDKVEDVYLQLTYQLLNGVLQKIISSIGSSEAEEIYTELALDENSPAYDLIKLGIDLQFRRNLNIDKVLETQKNLKNNPICQRILKELIINHIYMFPVRLETKQQLADKMNIPIQTQRNLEQIRESKG